MAIATIPNSTPITATTSSGATVTNPKGQLTSNDFMNLLITQLQNQDPTQPMSNQDLLQQVSQIGQLQSQQQLSTSMTNMVLQNQIGASANLLGKMVQGTDANLNPIHGIVTGIQVANNTVTLQLDNGNALSLDHVTSIANAATTTAAVSGATSTAASTGTPLVNN